MCHTWLVIVIVVVVVVESTVAMSTLTLLVLMASGLSSAASDLNIRNILKANTLNCK